MFSERHSCGPVESKTSPAGKSILCIRHWHVLYVLDWFQVARVWRPGALGTRRYGSSHTCADVVTLHRIRTGNDGMIQCCYCL